MGSDKNNGLMGCWLLYAALSGLLWLSLIVLKAFDMVSMGWIAVLLGGFWILPLLLAVSATLVLVVRLAARFKHWHRSHKVDRRIIRQAKAAGVWNKRPTPLGGRALELKAWEDFKIRRLPGETDAELRRRCIAAADQELAEAPRDGQMPELCASCWNEGCRNNEALRKEKAEVCEALEKEEQDNGL